MGPPAPRPSHEVRLEVDILTDEFAVPAPLPVLIVLVGADAALRGRIQAAVADTPSHELLEATSVLAMLAQLVQRNPLLVQPLRELLG